MLNLKEQLVEILKESGVDFKVISAEVKPVTICFIDQLYQGEDALHVALSINGEEIEWAYGQCNYIDTSVFDRSTVLKIMRLGF